MHTLKLLREQHGWIGLITLDGENQWGYKAYYKPNEKALSVIGTKFSSYEEAEYKCIEYIAKQINKENEIIRKKNLD